jgi:D-amino-acid dehydrogenase
MTISWRCQAAQCTVSGEEDHMTRRVGVIGAGMLGLATAWYLQEPGAEVTVLDRRGVAAGASWGNAGWITPALVSPLADPKLLRYGLAAVVKPSSPVYVPLRPDLGLLGFLARFTRNCTAGRFRAGLDALAGLSRGAAAAFDALTDGAAAGEAVRRGPIIACARRDEELADLLAELQHAAQLGLPVAHDRLTGAEAREVVPILSGAVGAAVRLADHRFIDPGRLLDRVARSVRARGGTILESLAALDIHADGGGVTVLTGGEPVRFDTVVVATGTWMPHLARKFGVRTRIQAGRGYSFSVPTDWAPSTPIYFPAHRVACTPLDDRLRIAGTMEFRRPEAAPDERRVRAIADAARPFLSEVDVDKRADTWVGARPCTPDGLPLIGPTASDRVWVAGGHGMWGITLGAVTGELVARAVMTGARPAQLAPFNPLR